MYRVVYTEEALKNLKKADKYTAKIITSWISKNLDNCENPRWSGKALQGELKGLWRYRIGDYRLICYIDDGKIVIMILAIGHRKEIYKRK